LGRALLRRIIGAAIQSMGARAMTSYRCFAIDLDGHIRGTEIVDCTDDVAAAREAQPLLKRHPAAERLEVWHLDRRIAVLTRGRRSAA
jgi:hypothetical protein